MPITALVGDLGSGKTLLMTYFGYGRYKKGQRVLTNYHVEYPHETLATADLINMDASLHNCVMLGDEFHMLMDSRNSMRGTNKAISYFVLQTRKRSVHMYFTTQDEGQVDIRLRMHVDYWVRCKKIALGMFQYKVFNRRGVKLGTFFLRGEKYYGLYDTNETISIPDFAAVGEEQTKPRRREIRL